MLYCVALYVVSCLDHVYMYTYLHVHVQFNSALSEVSDRAEGPVRAATPAAPKGVYTNVHVTIQSMYNVLHFQKGLKRLFLKHTHTHTHTQSKRVERLYKCICTCTTSFGYMNFHYTACEVNLQVIHLLNRTCTCTMYMYLLSHFLSPYRKLKYVAMSLAPRARR